MNFRKIIFVKLKLEKSWFLDAQRHSKEIGNKYSNNRKANLNIFDENSINKLLENCFSFNYKASCFLDTCRQQNAVYCFIFFSQDKI